MRCCLLLLGFGCFSNEFVMMSLHVFLIKLSTCFCVFVVFHYVYLSCVIFFFFFFFFFSLMCVVPLVVYVVSVVISMLLFYACRGCELQFRVCQCCSMSLYFTVVSTFFCCFDFCCVFDQGAIALTMLRFDVAVVAIFQHELIIIDVVSMTVNYDAVARHPCGCCMCIRVRVCSSLSFSTRCLHH